MSVLSAMLRLRPSLRGFGAVLCAIMLATALAPARALAHAELLETMPRDGATLAQPPEAITLRFNEPVSLVSLRLIDSAGRTIAGGEEPQLDSANALVRLASPPNLGPGSYVVSWRVVSADSHPIGGALVFTVGSGEAAPRTLPQPKPERDAAWQLAAIIVHFIQYASLLTAAGGALFASLVLRGRGAALNRLLIASGAVAIASTVLGVGVQGAWLTAGPATALLAGDAWRLGVGTTAGLSAGIAIAGLLIAAIGLFFSRGLPGPFIAVIGGALAAASFAFSGHAATVSPRWLAQPALAVHAIAAAFWLGAFWPLLQSVRRDTPAAALRNLQRFSRIAVAMVAALLLCGVLSAALRIERPDALVDTIYGRTLLFKLGFVALLLALAAKNRHRLTPALAAGAPSAASALARSIRREIGFGAVILFLTAVLAHTPPNMMVADHDHSQAAAPHAFSGRARAGDRVATATVTPAAAGLNAVTLRFEGREGRAFMPQAATVEFSLPDAHIKPFARPAAPAGTDLYRVDSVNLPIAGRWHLRIEALVSDFEKTSFELDVPIR